MPPIFDHFYEAKVRFGNKVDVSLRWVEDALGGIDLVARIWAPSILVLPQENLRACCRDIGGRGEERQGGCSKATDEYSGMIEVSLAKNMDWGDRAQRGFLASGIDPADRRGHKNYYIDLLQKMALEEVLNLKGNEDVLDFGCGGGRFSFWIAPRVGKVLGLEVTPRMIELAQGHRGARNVEFMLYDGIHFPFPAGSFDIILSVWVLQYLEGERLKRTLSSLAQYLKKGGKFYLIEQASDNPKVGRPSIPEYLNVFKESKLECLQYYPIRTGRWWVLYLIRYGIIPKRWLHRIARYELEERRKERKVIRFYKDFLFLLGAQ